ncbi:DUF429 domain-containing protein [Rubinisphaera italica]|nr:DUF429 domain-containing protein [Rubinisphaera italica]
MSAATTGQVVGICTAESGRLLLQATAVVREQPASHSITPNAVTGLYGELADRVFCKIENVQLTGSIPVDESILSAEAQKDLLNGQATVKRLTKATKKPKRAAKQNPVSVAPDLEPIELDSVELQFAIPPDVDEFVVGLDPTAATWESAMTVGTKKMPSFALRIKDGRLSVAESPLALHLTNNDFWQRVNDLKASLTCIDGPCGTNGPRLLDAYSAWADDGCHGTRDSEIQLYREGVGLFWTSQNTVMNFKGPDRWIARSLRLFSESPTIEKIETHPHGAFLFLWHSFGQEGKPPEKSKLAGQDARFAILKKFLPDLTRKMVPDHDAMDSAVAALVAALHRLGLTTSFGTMKNGGLIWMPNISDQVRRNGEN